MGAVASLESVYAHRHLLAFQTGRDATHEDHFVDAFQLADDCIIVDGQFFGHIDLQVGVPGLHKLETHLYAVFLAFLASNHGAGGGGAPGVLGKLALAVDIQLEMATALYVHHIFSRLFGSEHRLIFGREVLYLHTRGEDVHAGGGDGKRSGVVLGGHGLARHLGVVPERATEALLAIGSTLRGQQAVHHLVVGQVASLQVGEFLLLGLDAVEDGYRVVGHAVVVAPHQWLVVGIGTNHGYLLLVLSQRQHVAFVLQQHNRLAGHVERQLAMLFAVHDRIRYLRPFHKRGVVHLAQVETAFQEAYHMLVYFLLADQSAANGLGNALIGIAKTALHVGAGQRGLGRGMNGVG